MADISERRGAGAGGLGSAGGLKNLLSQRARLDGGSANRIRRIALGLSALWLVVGAAYGLGLLMGPGPEETGRPITAVDITLLVLALLAPVTLTAFGLAASAALDRLSGEAKALREELAALKQPSNPRPGRGAEQDVKKLLNEMQAERAALAEVLREAAARARSGELGRAQTGPSPAPATQAKSSPTPKPEPDPAPREAPPKAETETDAVEPPLPLDPPVSDARPELDWEAMVTAMEFPESESDRTAINALYKVLPDPMAARLMQSAEDVLSVLAGQALYMDELQLAPTTVEDWTRYLDGARGTEAEPIGAVMNDKALEQTSARLKRDGVFRDAALHFLLRYDAIAKRARAETGGDDYAPRMAATRTGKAYALLARALGRFDR